jgi:hypothetical protein
MEILGKSGNEPTPEDIEVNFPRKMKEMSEEVVPHLERELRRADELREFSRRIGVQNVNNVKTLSIKKVDRDGRIMSSQRERIEIKSIEFEKEEDPTIIGHPVIRYTYMDREGQENKELISGDVNFLKYFVYLLDACEDATIAKAPEKKKYIPHQGEEFSSRTIGDFKIESVKNGKIVTDRPVKVIPKEWLANNLSTTPEVYQDQFKKEFTPTEFAKLILQHGLKSKDNPDGDLMEDILEDRNYPENLREAIEEEKGDVEEEVKKVVEKETKKTIEDEVKKAAEETAKKAKKDLSLGLDENGREAFRNVDKTFDFGEKEYKEEALPYARAHKENDMETAKLEGPLRRFYKETRFLSVSDVFHLVKSCWDYYMRKFERNQKARYSSVAKNLFYFGGEMERVNQAAENEEAHQFQETYEHKGIPFIIDRMRVTSDRDEMKACFMVLCHKGQMRFEDIEMWRNMNRILPAKFYIPIPRNGNPATIINDTDHTHHHYRKTGLNVLESGVDHLWGQGTYSEWYAQNKSTYESGCKKFYTEGKEMEGYQGGHARRLQILLMEHKHGYFVDPQEYEGLILHAIEAGKSTFEAKLYFMIAGVASKNNLGKTILPYDRMAHLNSEMLTRFPILEYLCAQVPRIGPDGKTVKKLRYTIDDYTNWLEYFDGGDKHNCRPTHNVTKFLWKYVMPSHETNTRINKALRHGENFDHDDMHGYLPPAAAQIVDNACRTVGGGGKHLLTSEGYMNAAAGFNEYIKTLGVNKNKGLLLQAVNSYVRFEAIMMRRWQRQSQDYFRMTDSKLLNKPCVVTPNPPKIFYAELNSLMHKIGDAYAAKGDDRLKRMIDNIQQDNRRFDIKNNKKDKAVQDSIQYDLEQFDDILQDVVKMDNADTLMKIVSAAAEVPINESSKTGLAKEGGLTGTPAGLDPPENDVKLKMAETYDYREYNKPADPHAH